MLSRAASITLFNGLRLPQREGAPVGSVRCSASHNHPPPSHPGQRLPSARAFSVAQRHRPRRHRPASVAARRSRRAHHSAAGAFADVDHRVRTAVRHRHILQFPVEQAGIERLGLGEIAGMQFVCTNGFAMFISPLITRSSLRTPAANPDQPTMAARGRRRHRAPGRRPRQ